MAGRYGKFGQSLNEIDDKKKKKEAPKTVTDPNDEFAGGNPNVARDPNEAPQDSQPQSSSGNPLQTLKPLPKLYEGDGKDRKINPQYDTSIWQDMAAQAGMQRPTGDNYYDIGAKLGGLVGGIFNKNIAGKQQYQQDVQRIQQENKDTIVKTEAYLRAEAQKRLQDGETRRQQALDARLLRQQEVDAERDTEKKIKLVQGMIPITSGEDRESFQRQLAELTGRDPDAIKDDFGLQMSQKKFGEIVMNVTKGGEARYMTDPNGQVITDLSPQDWVNLLQDVEKGSDMSEESINAARQQATKILSANKDLFKTNKGGFDAQRFNAQVFTLSRDILKGQKNGKLPQEISINGVLIPLDGESAPRPAPPLQKQNDSPEGNSQFMPPIDGKAPEVVDATQTMGGDAPANGQPPANIPRTGETEITKPDKDYPDRIVANDGKSYASKRVNQDTKHLDVKRSYLSADKKTRLVYMDGAWIQIKLQN
jgi:hypothetical protein